MRLFELNNEENFGAITTMDISSDCETLVCGHEDGQLVLWNINTAYKIKIIFGIHSSPVLTITFWKDYKNFLLSTDLEGNLYSISIGKFFFSLIIDHQLLLEKNSGIISNISGKYLKFFLLFHYFKWNFFLNLIFPLLYSIF